MKKYIALLLIVLVFGTMLGGVGYFLYRRSDNKLFSKEIAYTEQSYECEEEISEVKLNLQGRHNLKIEEGEGYGIKYFVSEFNSAEVKVQEGAFIFDEETADIKGVKMLFYKYEPTDVVLTVPAGATPKLNITSMGTLDITEQVWRVDVLNLRAYGLINIDAEIISSGSVSFDFNGIVNMNVNSNSERFEVHNNGITNINGNIVAEDEVVLHVNGILNMYASVDSATSVFDCNGTGDVKLTGNSNTVSYFINGRAIVEAQDYFAETVKIMMNGKGNLNLAVSKDIIIDGDGTCEILNKCSATINHNSFYGNLSYSQYN